MNKTDSNKPQVCLSAFAPACPSAQRSPSHHRPADQPGLMRSNRSPRPTWKANKHPPPPIQMIQNTRLNTNNPTSCETSTLLLCTAIRVPNPQRGAVYRTPHAVRAGRPLGSLDREHDRHRRQSAHRGERWCVCTCVVCGVCTKQNRGGESQVNKALCGEDLKTNEQGRKGGIPHRSPSPVSLSRYPPLKHIFIYALLSLVIRSIFCPSKKGTFPSVHRGICPSPKPKRPSRKITNVVV